MTRNENQKIRVGLVYGGRSLEHEVSIASALSVYEALDKARYDVTLIAIDKTGRWLLPDAKLALAQARDPISSKIASTDVGNTVSLIPYQDQGQFVANPQMHSSRSLTDTSAQQRASSPHVDVLFPVLHGTYGEDGTIQGLLELAQIPYVGTGVLGSALGMDKEVSRKLLHACGIQTVKTRAVRHPNYVNRPEAEEALILEEFALPCFVKPANSGSSVGVSKVKTPVQLRQALLEAFAVDRKILVEAAIEARELECAVLGNDEPRVSAVGEVIPHHEFYSYEAKYLDPNGNSQEIPAKDVPPNVIEKIQSWALKAFEALECRGLARVDFFLDKRTGELYLNEINTMPGFTKMSMYPKLWEASGLSYSALLDELIQLALERAQDSRVSGESSQPRRT